MSKKYSTVQSFRWLRLLTLLLLLLPLAGRAQIVISQAYGGGGNVGSVYKNDFIELFNRGTVSVDVTGWTVQYASATGTFSVGGASSFTTLSGTIEPGRYLLIKQAAGAGGTTDLPTADVTGTIPMGGASFKVALVRNNTVATASAGPTTTFSSNVVDFVGVGTANAYEGATVAPLLTNATAAIRASNGCTDANNNGADFTAVAANPRNSATAAAPCGAATGTCAAPGAPTFASTTISTSSVSFVPDATNTANYTVTATPASGPAVTASGAASPITLTGLLAGTTYTVTVAGTCVSGGTSPLSTSASLTTLASTVTCVAPTDVAVGTIATTGASVSFTGDASATNGYTVTATPSVGSAITATGSESPIALTGLANNTTYEVTVRSNCDGSTETSTPAVSFTTLLAAPTLTSINPTSMVAGETRTIAFAGSNFVSGSTVNFNGTSVATTFVSITSLTAEIAAPLSSADAVFPVSVTTTAGTSTTRNLTVRGVVTPISISAVNTAYTENFNTLATSGTSGTLPAGWSFIESGSSDDQLYTASSGTLTAGDTYSYGTGAAADRALGSQASGNLQATFGASYTNNTGVAITNLRISYTGEQWRLGEADRNTFDNLAFGYASSGASFAAASFTPFSGLDFTTPNITGTAPLSRDGNASAYRSTITRTITGLSIAPGEKFFIRWADSNISGSDDGLAIDDFSLTANAVPPSIVVNDARNLSGDYTNVTITSSGRATLNGPLTIAGTLLVQAGGSLLQSCQPITGPGDFVLEANAGLVICDLAGIATTGAVGAVRVTGTRTYSPGAGYIYNGTGLQVTGTGLPAQVGAIGVANPLGVTLSQAVSVAKQVTLQVGNLNTGDFTFTLLSDAEGTAVVDNGSFGSVVNGSTTVQRYISSANPLGYRHYSAPVSNTTVNDLATSNFTPIFNTSYNTSPTPGTVKPFPTVFRYDQNRITTAMSNYPAFDKGWFSPAAGDAMAVNRGYSVNAPNTALVDFVGTLNNGPQLSGPLSRDPQAQAGWQFLGNPYPAPLNWSTVTPAQRPNMDAAMYVYQSSGQYSGSYRSFANGIGGSPLIVTGSGYFVRVSTAGTIGAVNLTNANRVPLFGDTPIFGRGTADSRPQLQLQLRGTSGRDEAYVYFEAGATAGLDAQYDAVKMSNPSGLSLASATGSAALAINGLPELGASAVLVPLNVAVPRAGNYSFEAAAVTNLAGTTVTLVDALTATRTVLTAGGTYAFAVAGTSATGRFSLEFRTSGVLATNAAQALSAQTQLFPNPASASFRVQLPLLRSKAAVSATLSNALGQTVLTRSLSAPAGQAIHAEFDVRGLARGIYTLRLTMDGEQVVRKVVVE
ncbi:lamin tail domain-containing protein [Hymenobacter sp. BT683]|uniref:Lamin tail domain-containing protein n=1 Tax=Hymenobacter jeongseonensis TaxID=2791027 RepID=A0ABS0IE64_9BACT|nr:lamin tail domain-containing protein [Hymenobacter jeongseonensis]MBF9236649.1 lamin tail domain-containing protein [Hymenobacter jeongseonensis]